MTVGIEAFDDRYAMTSTEAPAAVRNFIETSNRALFGKDSVPTARYPANDNRGFLQRSL